MPAMPGARLAVIETEIVLGVLEAFFDGPAQPGGRGQVGRYLQGHVYAGAVGGFRHSDTVAVTRDGLEFLTYYPRDLDSLTLPV